MYLEGGTRAVGLIASRVSK